MFIAGYTGPVYNEEGQPLIHTILGNWQDFHMEAIRRGDIEVHKFKNVWHLCCSVVKLL